MGREGLRAKRIRTPANSTRDIEGQMRTVPLFSNDKDVDRRAKHDAEPRHRNSDQPVIASHGHNPRRKLRARAYSRTLTRALRLAFNILLTEHPGPETFSFFKIGHSLFQIRPLGVETGQHRKPNRNKPRKGERSVCTAARCGPISPAYRLTKSHSRVPSAARD
jgi:hypothetical protein